jgi:alanyl-tRNA synthetase
LSTYFSQRCGCIGRRKAHTGEIIKVLSAKVGGKGGGRPDMAKGGGPKSEALQESLESVFDLVPD